MSQETLTDARTLVSWLGERVWQPVVLHPRDVALLKQVLCHHECLMRAYLELEEKYEKLADD